MTSTDSICRLTGSESAVFHDAVAERRSSRQAYMPSQHVEQQAACIHTHQLDYHPSVCQHSSDQHQQGLDVQQHNAGEHHMQSHGRGGKNRAPARRLSQSQAALLEGAAPRHQAVYELSLERMLVEEDAARQQGCDQLDRTVRRAQQQPVVLPRQQPSEMYHLPQPTDDSSSGPAQHDVRVLPPSSYQKPGETIAAAHKLILKLKHAVTARLHA